MQNGKSETAHEEKKGAEIENRSGGRKSALVPINEAGKPFRKTRVAKQEVIKKREQQIGPKSHRAKA